MEFHKIRARATFGERHQPVAYIDTSRPVTVKLVAGGITISGPAPEMLRLVHVTDELEGWTVRVDSQMEQEWFYPQAGRYRRQTRPPGTYRKRFLLASTSTPPLNVTVGGMVP